LAGAACSGSRTLAFEDLAPEVIAASCRVSVQCGQATDEAACAASTQTAPSMFETFKHDIDAGIVKYDGRAARACVDTYATIASCTYTEILRAEAVLDPTCGKVLTGTLAPGTLCYFSEECANGGTCDRPSCTGGEACCAGTCVPAPIMVQAGGDCGTANTECVTGTHCAPNLQTASALICEPNLAAGAACTTTADACAVPYSCVAADPTVSAGMCTAPAATGEACGTTSEFSSLCNDLRDACDASTGVCARRTPVGGACSALVAGACVGTAVCDGTTCVARGGPGAACDPTLSTPCLAQLQCDPSMHCTLPTKGASCR